MQFLVLFTLEQLQQNNGLDQIFVRNYSIGKHVYKANNKNKGATLVFLIVEGERRGTVGKNSTTWGRGRNKV